MIFDVNKFTTITSLMPNTLKPRMQRFTFFSSFFFTSVCVWIWLSSLLVLLQHASYFVWSFKFSNPQVLCWCLRSNSFFFFFLVCFSRIFWIDFSKILFSLYLESQSFEFSGNKVFKLLEIWNRYFKKESNFCDYVFEFTFNYFWHYSKLKCLTASLKVLDKRLFKGCLGHR